MKSITIGSLQIHSNTSDIGYFVQIPISGLEVPPIRVSKFDKPGEHGAFLSNLIYAGRRVTFEGVVFGSDIATFETRRRNLIKELRVARDSDGIPTPKLLKFTAQDDLNLQANCHVVGFKLAIENLTHARFFIDLFVADFTLDAQSLTITNVSLEQNVGGIIYPVIYPAVYDVASGGRVTIANNGDAEALPIIKLKGSLSNPVIENETLNRAFQINFIILSGKTVTIDMKKKTVLLDDGTNLIDKKTDTSKFWWLEPGSNTIELNNSAEGDAGDADIEHRHAYTGV